MLNEDLSNTIVIGDRDNNDTAPVTASHNIRGETRHSAKWRR